MTVDPKTTPGRYFDSGFWKIDKLKKIKPFIAQNSKRVSNHHRCQKSCRNQR
jgi:hypothetical protein